MIFYLSKLEINITDIGCVNPSLTTSKGAANKHSRRNY